MLHLFLFPLLLVRLSRGECPRPHIPPRMLIEFPHFNETVVYRATTFPVGTRAFYRCDEDYNDFNAPSETVSCQEDGSWWPKYIPNFCANDLERELTVKQHPDNKSYLMPLNRCLTKDYESLEIDLGGLVKLNHFAIMSERDAVKVSVKLIVKENGHEIMKEAVIIEGLFGGEEKLVDCDLQEVTHIAVKTPIPLCSLRIGVLNPENPSKCRASLAGSPEGGRLVPSVLPNQVAVSCDFAQEETAKRCDEKGYWAPPQIECFRPQKLSCSENSAIMSNYGEYTCSLEQVNRSLPGCHCDPIGGYVRHPNGTCGRIEDCPDGSQRHCADFEVLTMNAPKERSCGKENLHFTLSHFGFHCTCKPGLVRMVSTGKCVAPEQCPSDDRRQEGDYDKFDVNCDGTTVYYNYDEENYGFCEKGLLRTRRGHCMKKELCPQTWKKNWLATLLGIGDQ